MTHLKNAGPLLISDFSVVAHKPQENCARFWLRKVPNDLHGATAFVRLYMRQGGELLQEHGLLRTRLGGSLLLSQV